MRPINADVLADNAYEIYVHASPEFKERMITLKMLIDNAPTLDAVPVVRCKDCKHWGTDWALGETEYVKCCEFGRYMVGANGYCVYGEVKNND